MAIDVPAQQPIRAVLWDFGGVILSSPFVAFAAYERKLGLPTDFIRQLNARNPDDNAWARLERGDYGPADFAAAFEAEAEALGYRLDGLEVLRLLGGSIQPEMVAALKAVKARYKTACLTNNARTGHGPGMAADPARAREIAAVMSLFDAVIESSKVGCRKPEPRFYEIACATLGIAPTEAVFLDDLGINLKPARAMGMRTIKVAGPAQAIADLEAVLGHAL